MGKYDDADLSVLDLESNLKQNFIADNDTIAKYTAFVNEGKTELLPKDVYYYEEDGVLHFYTNEEYSDEEIAAKLEISKANSLRSIAACLKYFVCISIIGVVFAIIVSIVKLAIK